MNRRLFMFLFTSLPLFWLSACDDINLPGANADWNIVDLTQTNSIVSDLPGASTDPSSLCGSYIGPVAVSVIDDTDVVFLPGRIEDYSKGDLFSYLPIGQWNGVSISYYIPNGVPSSFEDIFVLDRDNVWVGSYDNENGETFVMKRDGSSWSEEYFTLPADVSPEYHQLMIEAVFGATLQSMSLIGSYYTDSHSYKRVIWEYNEGEWIPTDRVVPLFSEGEIGSVLSSEPPVFLLNQSQPGTGDIVSDIFLGGDDLTDLNYGENKASELVGGLSTDFELLADYTVWRYEGGQWSLVVETTSGTKYDWEYWWTDIAEHPSGDLFMSGGSTGYGDSSSDPWRIHHFDGERLHDLTPHCDSRVCGIGDIAVSDKRVIAVGKISYEECVLLWKPIE